MATRPDWLDRVRLWTLPAAAAPVIAGSAVAAHHHGFQPLRALLALVVAVALQAGVNLYRSDRRVAFAALGLGAFAGLALVVGTGAWFLLLIGAACLAAAWLYTAGRRPDGPVGLDEGLVFVFFGPVAAMGATFVQLLRVPEGAVWAGIGFGAFAAALLTARRLRDLAADTRAGRASLPVFLGDRWSRWMFVGLVFLGMFGVHQVAASTSWWGLLAFLAVLALVGPVRLVLDGALGQQLARAARLVGVAELGASVLLLIGLGLG